MDKSPGVLFGFLITLSDNITTRNSKYNFLFNWEKAPAFNLYYDVKAWLDEPKNCSLCLTTG